MAKQTKSQRAKLRTKPVRKPRQSRAQSLASSENTKLLAPKTEPDPNPWLRVRAWIRRMVGK